MSSDSPVTWISEICGKCPENINLCFCLSLNSKTWQRSNKMKYSINNMNTATKTLRCVQIVSHKWKREKLAGIWENYANRWLIIGAKFEQSLSLPAFMSVKCQLVRLWEQCCVINVTLEWVLKCFSRHSEASQRTSKHSRFNMTGWSFLNYHFIPRRGIYKLLSTRWKTKAQTLSTPYKSREILQHTVQL